MSTASPMAEALIVSGALIGFCLLAFGAAWLMATWIGAIPVRRRRTRRDRG